MYAARAGLSATLFEGLMVGGQLTSIDQLENYPGFAQGVNGFEIAVSMREQAERFGAQFVLERVEAIESVQDSADRQVFALKTADHKFEAKTVILARGAKPRKLPIEGIDDLVGRGVSYCATCDGNFFRSKDAVVVGGGDTACSDVVYLSRIVNQVHLVHRRHELRASKWYEQQLEGLTNLTIHWDSVVSDVQSCDGKVCAVELQNVHDDSTSNLACDALFIAVGTEPDTAWVSELVDLDSHGYIISYVEGQTSHPGVFAAGDTRTTTLRQVVTAVSDGALAAESAAKYIASW